MMLSNDGLKFIVDFEGKEGRLPDGRYQAYRCIVGRDKNGRPIHDGKWTIYTGLTEGVYEGMIITEAEGEAMFRKELVKHEVAVASLVKVPVTQHQADALISFSYNCGSGALSKSTLLKKLNKGDYDGAAREFGNWVNSNGVKKVPGLVRRRREETALFLRPSKTVSIAEAATVPAMPQTVDVPAPVSAAVQSSRTVFGVLIAGAASLFGWCKDLVLEAANQLSLLAPAKEIASGLGLKAATIAFVLTIAGLAIALFARLDDAAKGKNPR